MQNWLISDPLYQFYPFLTQSVQTLQAGSLLLWNPGIFLGHPAGADPLFQTFYPTMAGIALLLGVARGLAIGLYLHVLLAALLTYGLLRSLQLSRPAAVLGAFTYALSGYLITWLETPFWTTTLAWLPGVLWAFQGALVSRRWRYVAVAGLLFGFAFLAGNFQFLVVFAGVLAVLALGYMVWQRRSGVAWSFWPMVTVVFIGLIGALVGAAQVVPFAEFLPLTRRATEIGLADPILPGQMVTLLLPNFFGNPSTGDYWGPGNYAESTVYVGIVALLLATIGLTARWRGWSAIVAVTVIGLFYFALGGPGVAALRVVPFLKSGSLHRSLFVLPLLVGWLAAITVSRREIPWRHAVLVGGSLVGLALLAAYFNWNAAAQQQARTFYADLVVALILIGGTCCVLVARQLRPTWRPLADWALVVLVFTNLYWHGGKFNPVGPIDKLMPENPVTDAVRNLPGAERIVALQRNGDLLFGPNVLTAAGLAEPGGYSSLVLPELHDLISQDDPEIDIGWAQRSGNMVLFSYPSDRLLDLFSVRYLVSSEELFDPGPEAEFVGGTCTTQLSLSTSTPLAGAFDAWHTAINRVDIPFVVSEGAPLGGDVRFRLWRDGTDGELIAETQLPIADILASPTQTIYFAPESDAPGRTYAWELVASHDGDGSVNVCGDLHAMPAISVYGAQLAELYSDDSVWIYERYAPFYRASVVYGAEYIADATIAQNRMLDPEFDLRNTAVVEAPVALPEQSPRPAQAVQIRDVANDRRGAPRHSAGHWITCAHRPILSGLGSEAWMANRPRSLRVNVLCAGSC